MSPITATGTCTFISKDLDDQTAGRCDVGMVTAAALFPVKAGEATEITATIPLAATASATLGRRCLEHRASQSLQTRLPRAALPVSLRRRDHLADPAFAGRRLSRALHLQALLVSRCRVHHPCPAVRRPDRARRTRAGALPGAADALGYFRSQEGEWDANGEVLWIMQRFFALTGRPPIAGLAQAPSSAARAGSCASGCSDDLDAPHAGLLPAGFSAEHLGPNDYYYWDDFWGIAGLRAAAAHARASRMPTRAARVRAGRRRFRGGGGSQPGWLRATARPAGHARIALPPPGCRRHRFAGGRLSGAAVRAGRSAPARLRRVPAASAVSSTARSIQDMIHSGLNAYLTLHVAQVLLRAGDPRHLELMDAVAGPRLRRPGSGRRRSIRAPAAAAWATAITSGPPPSGC